MSSKDDLPLNLLVCGHERIDRIERLIEQSSLISAPACWPLIEEMRFWQMTQRQLLRLSARWHRNSHLDC